MLNKSYFWSNITQSLDDNEWTRPALASCRTLQWIGGYLCLVFSFGIGLNGIVLYTLLRKKCLQLPISTYMIALSSADFIHALFGIPLPMTSSLACRWLYGKYLCYYEGFIAYFVGMIGLYLLTALSLNRYWIIVTSTQSKCVNTQTTYILIVLAILGSFFWAIAPVFGWNDYTLEGVLTSCSIRWQDGTLNVISYNIMMFIFAYIIPLFIMLYCNIKIYLQVHHASKRSLLWKRCLTLNRICQKDEIEKRVGKSVFLIIITFTISWTPYAIVAFISSFFSPTLISPLGATLPAIFAKSSIFFNPLVFIMTNSQFRAAILYQRNQSSTTNESTSSKERNNQTCTVQLKLLTSVHS